MYFEFVQIQPYRSISAVESVGEKEAGAGYLMLKPFLRRDRSELVHGGGGHLF